MKRLCITLCFLLTISIGWGQDNLIQGVKYYDRESYAEALPYLQKAAKEGYGEACYLLGKMYREGLGTEKNYAIAHTMFERGIEFGYTKGDYELGWMCRLGEGCEKDTPKALEYFEKSMDKGNPEGCYGFGVFYFEGWNGTKDFAKAASYFEKLIYPGPFYQAHKGYYYYAVRFLGSCYENGLGNPQKRDLYRAAKFYESVWDGDCKFRQAFLRYNYNVLNQMNGGSDYFETYSILKSRMDFKELKISDDSGVFEYLYAMALAKSKRKTFQHGMSVPIEYFRMLSDAAEKGYPRAYKLLGDCYKEGNGTTMNLMKAKEWYEKAKENGFDPEILNRLDSDAEFRNSQNIYKIGDYYEIDGQGYIVLCTDINGNPTRLMDCSESECLATTGRTIYNSIKGLFVDGKDNIDKEDINTISTNLEQINETLAKHQKPLISNNGYLYQAPRFDNFKLSLPYHIHRFGEGPQLKFTKDSKIKLKVRLVRNIYYTAEDGQLRLY